MSLRPDVDETLTAEQVDAAFACHTFKLEEKAAATRAGKIERKRKYNANRAEQRHTQTKHYRDIHKADEKRRLQKWRSTAEGKAKRKAWEEANRELILEKARAKYHKNKEVLKAKARAKYQENKEVLKAKARSRYHAAKSVVQDGSATDGATIQVQNAPNSG